MCGVLRVSNILIIIIIIIIYRNRATRLPLDAGLAAGAADALAAALHSRWPHWVLGRLMK